MSLQELIVYLNEHIHENNKFLTCVSRFEKYKDIKQYIIKYTPHLDNDININERVFCLLNNIEKRQYCKECNNIVSFDRVKKRYRDFCSLKCSNGSNLTKEKKEKTLTSNYGVINPSHSDIIREKYKNTCMERYGKSHYSHTQQYKQKYKDTCIERYGVETTAILSDVIEKKEKTNLELYGNVAPSKNEDVKEKTRQTCLSRYGTDSFVKTEKFKEKTRQTCLSRYNVDNFNKKDISEESLMKLENKEWLINQHHQNKKSLLEISKILDVNDTTVGRYCKKHGVEVRITGTSIGENEISEYIKSLCGERNVHNNIKGIVDGRYELDIYIPDLKIAIEYCGLYWHSEIYKDKEYHLKKLEKCNERDIRLIHIFENEWTHSKQIVKEKLRYIISRNVYKIYGRNTTVIKVPTEKRKQFLKKYHIQGNGAGSLSYGLVYNGVLVSLMVFKKRKNGVYELNRFASSSNVIGAFSKLLSHFKKNHEWDEIISFADRRWSEGDVYLKNGFFVDKILKPDYKYIIGDNIFHKFNFRHKTMKWKLKVFDPSLSEHKNMISNKIYRIYDCGLIRFVMKNRDVK